jgi:hypothetical protein
MKASCLRCALLCLAFLSLTVWVHADAAAYAQILKDRDATLSKILQVQESRYAMSLVDEAAVFSAKLALYSFRRDTASSVAARIDQQKAIVSIYEGRQDFASVRSKAGFGDSVDLLLTTDQLLQAKQVLEELQTNGQKG